MFIVKTTVDLNTISDDNPPKIEMFEIVRQNGTGYKYFVDGTVHGRPSKESPRIVPNEAICTPIPLRNPLTCVCYWFVSDIGDEKVIRKSEDYKLAIRESLKYLSRSNEDMSQKLKNAYRVCFDCFNS